MAKGHRSQLNASPTAVAGTTGASKLTMKEMSNPQRKAKLMSLSPYSYK